jgi:hypothetical protein
MNGMLLQLSERKFSHTNSSNDLKALQMVCACTRRHTSAKTTICTIFYPTIAENASKNVKEVNQHSSSHVRLHIVAQAKQICCDTCVLKPCFAHHAM